VEEVNGQVLVAFCSIRPRTFQCQGEHLLIELNHTFMSDTIKEMAHNILLHVASRRPLSAASISVQAAESNFIAAVYLNEKSTIDF
jgi:hypothetical protein